MAYTQNTVSEPLVPVEALRREALGGRSTCLSASLPHDGSSRPRTHREGHRMRSAPPGTARPCLSRACGRRSARVCTCSHRCTRSPAALTDSRMGWSEEDEERGGGERGGGESVLHHTARHSATQHDTAPHIRRLPSPSSHLVRADEAPYGAGEGGGVECLGRGEKGDRGE